MDTKKNELNDIIVVNVLKTKKIKNIDHNVWGEKNDKIKT